ncbi:MAG: aminotransferase class V-fold PLP-dependent enzyme [Acidobacteria bacterium]|nr:aminotransferase class V-fold PLP-dependent enzyme [Acidobacteriota bacterium]
MATRRHLLKSMAAGPLAAGAANAATTRSAEKSGGSIYARLGVKPVINGVGVVTVLGGSIMPPEVVQAMNEASQWFIPLPELHKKVGARIAELLKVEGAMVTCGAASAIQVAATVCITRGDQKKLQQLPSTEGLRFEVVQQKTHRSGYEQQMLAAGARIVWVETREEAERAIGPNTAMMFFLNKAEPMGAIKRTEWIELGKKHGIPTFNDAASDATPRENLWKYVHEGFDLVAFSGGKALLGPQASGLLLGKKDLIEAAMLSLSPYGGVGRGMKVGKEEMVGLLAAVERYLKVDHEAEMRELGRRVTEMTTVLSSIDGLKLERHVPQIANEVPHLAIEWDETKIKATSQQITEKLRENDPPIHIQRPGEGRLLISVWMMRGTEHRIVARRLAELFRAG